MTSTFIPGKTPCFECLFFQQPGSLERAGVIGPAPSIIAGVQSMETLKFILGMDGLLASRLLYFKGKKMAFREMSIEGNPDCKRCGTPAGGAHG
jgi:adenylyltransferase/sulfurtransferase